jgi:hypothetical protein
MAPNGEEVTAAMQEITSSAGETPDLRRLLHLVEAAQRAGCSEDEIREIVESALAEDAGLGRAA